LSAQIDLSVVDSLHPPVVDEIHEPSLSCVEFIIFQVDHKRRHTSSTTNLLPIMKLNAIACLLWCSIHTSSSTSLLPLLRDNSVNKAVAIEGEDKSATTDDTNDNIFNSQHLQSAASWHVKLEPGTDKSYLKTFGSVEPLFTLPQDTLKKLSLAASDLPDLTLWYRVTPPKNPSNNGKLSTTALFDKELVADIVIPMDAPPPGIDRQLQSGTPNFQGIQGYLRQNLPDNNGIDAEYSWNFVGGNGEGVTIYDIEYNWNIYHEDLDATIETIVNNGDSINSPFDESHGTGVLGEMIGAWNGFGVQGISDMAKVKVVPEVTVMGHTRANAILLAVNDGQPGDVILLEMQTGVCGLGWGEWGPAEGDQSVFDATKIAVANGFVVVAAAGNGNVNLDRAECGGRFDRNIRDSGAIIVGAGGSGVNGCSPARQKMWFSTFGSRVDVHGWGECVVTTGPGDLYNPGDPNRVYMSGFSGTSSASPFVAAAAANIQGIAMANFGHPLEPKRVREILRDSGIPQVDPNNGAIGPLVNLRGAIDRYSEWVVDTAKPTCKPTTKKPTSKMPTTKKPTLKQTPTMKPTTRKPTSKKPTSKPTPKKPTSKLWV
jgi:hypothetical protein